ncbi:hypothetical protein OOK13_34695 [Streptomyces sp. NBC_00378]|uniref:hypothetical protein n=1 Tax=Streptomyces sp. NBC_00378 TaxID=2975732 RepID=UPI0022596418|nr:hypothetical protein [Streptomyces sp. NBC_00378]MCX5113510.1 hypothetical protein [Streptomyces sp. NBC_00378]
MDELHSQRSSLHGISRDFQLAHYAGRRHARIPDVDDLLVKVTSRLTLLDDFKPYSCKRFTGGFHNARLRPDKIGGLRPRDG